MFIRNENNTRKETKSAFFLVAGEEGLVLFTFSNYTYPPGTRTQTLVIIALHGAFYCLLSCYDSDKQLLEFGPWLDAKSASHVRLIFSCLQFLKVHFIAETQR